MNLKLILPVLLLITFSCSKESESPMLETVDNKEKEDVIEPPKNITANELQFQAAFHPAFDNTIYPSMILGLSSTSSSQSSSLELLTYFYRTVGEKKTLKIELQSSLVNNTDETQIEMLTEGIDSFIIPEINWDYENLSTLNQPGTVDLNFKAFVDNHEIDNKSIRLNFKSVNECVIGYFQGDEFVNTYQMFGAYVNEYHPLADSFLEEALDSPIIDSFKGYQNLSEFSVMNQVLALWYTLQAKGVKYSNVASLGTQVGNIVTQNVRFFDEVYSSTQANCVDGTLFLASLLQRIGIKSTLVVIPGHMYLGYYTKPDKSQIALLETTMIGSVDHSEINHPNDLLKDKYSLYFNGDVYNAFINGLMSVEDVRHYYSNATFGNATSANVQDSEKIFNTSEPEYFHMEVEQLRSIIQPIPR